MSGWIYREDAVEGRCVPSMVLGEAHLSWLGLLGGGGGVGGSGQIVAKSCIGEFCFVSIWLRVLGTQIHCLKPKKTGQYIGLYN